jgi:ATP-dependent helicase Lhr and Lhr-like helicase
MSSARVPLSGAPDPLGVFGAATQAWFRRAFEGPTPVQAEGWARIASGQHALLLAPTGSGKTLAAFLEAIDRLARRAPIDREGVRVVYVSPLKALAHDVERNLRRPLVGISEEAQRLGIALIPPRVAIRSGDTPARERRLQARDPAEILVTTPESLYLILGSQAREGLRNVETIIVDEVHALAPTKRGAHLAISLERLAALTGADPQRIGLSATATPVEEVARYLGGDRPVCIVDESAAPLLDLEVVVPVADMTRPEAPADRSGEAPPQPGIWPPVVAELVRLIEAHRTTIVFVNSRGLCERLVQRIVEASGNERLVRSHHGSLSQAHRREVEAMLKEGRIRAIVATSSLELGIDMGAVDLVVMVESPGGVARGLQRVGRAGHGVGEISKGRIFPKHRGDLLEATVVARRMREGVIEPLALPKNPLDVLAQQVVAICALESQRVDDVERVVRRAASYRELPKGAFESVIDMLSGRYPSTSFSDLRPRLTWDREAQRLSARQGSRMLAIVSGGTIPDRGLYGVHLGADGARVGELDEEMVHETQPGHVVTLGASSWRVEAISRDRVVVSPAPGEVGRMPFWRGEGPGRPIELGRALGRFLREIEALSDEAATAWLVDEHHLQPLAADNLLRYLREQQRAALPTDRTVVVERFRDELGDVRICLLTPFGARVHAPWALALEARLGRDRALQAMWSDDGICLRIADAEELPVTEELFPDASEIEDLVVEHLGDSALFASRFRENAARALLLPRRRPGMRTPLWQQRLKAQQLLAIARAYPSFPIVVETFRECLQDVFDLPALRDLLAQIASGEVRVAESVSSAASPFSRSLVFAFAAAYLYEGDAPAAERRAQALALDRDLLRELLGETELRALLDPAVMAAIEDELQHLTDDRKIGHLDGLHDLLRRLGALEPEAIARRARVDVGPLLAELERQRRAVCVELAGARHFVAVEDVALYRDALGVTPPAGLPAPFLEPVADAREALAARWARTHGPFPVERFARDHGLSVEAALATLERLEGESIVTRGAFLREGEAWCDREVLRRIKRRTLSRLRSEVEPVDRATFARFLPTWHGVAQKRRGKTRVEEVLAQLEGLPISYAELERSIFPARIDDFSPRMLDELGAMGLVVWVGAGQLGASDGRVALYRRERIGKLHEPPTVDRDALSPLALALHDHLERRGASFFPELKEACRELQPAEGAVMAALWELVWAGLVTNDTFGPLRALAMRASTRRPQSDLRTAGRWSLVAQLLGEVSPTERAHAQTLMLLERHGVVSRETAALESIPGGFAAIYPVLRSMEEAGKIRRGYFVEGIRGAQFAFPGAVDRLRASRGPAKASQVMVLSAADPANPYGFIVPWPPKESRQPRRSPGALLVLVDGAPALYLERGGKALLTFDPAPATLQRGFDALRAHLARRSRRTVHIETIDGEPALRSAHAPALKALGVGFDHRGLVIERNV